MDEDKSLTLMDELHPWWCWQCPRCDVGDDDGDVNNDVGNDVDNDIHDK